MPDFELLKIQHVSVIVAELDSALNFYHRILGLPLASNRPDLGYPGAWLELADQQIHLLQLPNPDPVAERPAHGGRDRHIAIVVRGFDKIIRELEQQAIVYTLSKSGRHALFVRDPDGNTLELIAGED